ncbi:MAG: DoxX family protein [Pseudomonadota bacterium]
MKIHLKSVLIWIPLLLLAVPTGAAGVAKLMGVPEIHASFAAMQLPSWFGYFIGMAEIAGAIGVLLPRLSALAAICLLPIMLGATYYHLFVDGSSALFAIFLASLCIVTVFIRRSQAQR